MEVDVNEPQISETEKKRDDGNDTVNQPDGNDTVNQSDGNDTVNQSDGNDTVNQPDGNDTVNQTDDKDIVNQPTGIYNRPLIKKWNFYLKSLLLC